MFRNAIFIFFMEEVFEFILFERKNFYLNVFLFYKNLFPIVE